jgi:hypothetical protein
MRFIGFTTYLIAYLGALALEATIWRDCVYPMQYNPKAYLSWDEYIKWRDWAYEDRMKETWRDNK